MFPRAIAALSLAFIMTITAAGSAVTAPALNAPPTPLLGPAGLIDPLGMPMTTTLGSSILRVPEHLSAAIREKLMGEAAEASEYVYGIKADVGPITSALSAAPVRIITSPLTITGTEFVEAEWVVKAPLTIDGGTLVFRNTRIQHHTIRGDPGVTITIKNAVIRQEDGDMAAWGRIQSTGPMVVEGSTISEIRIQALAQNSTVDPTFNAGTSRILNNRFNNAIEAVLTDQNMPIRGNVFTNSYTALHTGLIGAVAQFKNSANPLVENNTFEQNEYAIYVDSGGLGTFHNNRIQANYIGAQCISSGDQDGDGVVEKNPTFTSNNLAENFGDAVFGLRGITILLPNGESVTIDDSACNYDRNYMGGSGNAADSTFTSSADSITNTTTSEISLPSAPALPYPLRLITGSTTWSTSSPPPAITGPVVVKSPGSLTVQDISLNLNGFSLGAKLNGNLDVTNVDLLGRAQLYQRNQGDTISDVEIASAPLFEGLISHRNSGTISNLRVLNAGPLAAGVILNSGQLVDDVVWTPTLQNSRIEKAGAGVVSLVNKPNIQSNVFQGNTGPGIFGQLIASGTINDNDFKRNVLGLGGLGTAAFTLNSFTSSNNLYEGGLSSYFSGALNTPTFTSDIIANNMMGWFSQLDTNPAITNTLFAFNAAGVGVAAGTATVTSSDFTHNYGVGAFTIDVVILPGAPSAGVINCSSCWFESDESKEGTVTGANALTPNTGVPKPAWWDDRVVVNSGTTDLTGTLDGPVVARTGGKIRILDTDLNLNGFAIGAKGGGPQGTGETGKLEIRRSDVRNGGLIGMNSTDVVIENSRITDFTATVLGVFQNQPTIRCNAIERATQGIWTLKGGNSTELVFEKNLVKQVGNLRFGFDRRIPGYYEHATVNDNGFVDTITSISRSGMGDLEALRNNYLTVNTGVFDGGIANVPSRADISDGYWYHTSGPRVLKLVERALNGQVMFAGLGAIAQLQPYVVGAAAQGAENDLAKFAKFQPFRTDPVKQTPCMNFRFTPASPTETTLVQFDDRSIAPAGLGVTKRTWNFGDGSPVETDLVDGLITHDFVDGGSFTVTLTVETGDGSTGTVSKTIAVSQVAPVSSFTVGGIVNELTAVPFTDTSTHPNAGDAPPTGWAFAWDFNGEGSSTAPNPSFRFPDGGSKVVKLRVTDNDGQSHESQQTISVPHGAPVAGFSVAGTSETDTYQLTDTSTHPNAPTDGIVTRAWSCTDGFSSTAQNPSHKFADGGAYSCTLTVTDNDGQSGTVTKSISVAHVAPAADFTSGTANELQALAFTDASTHPNAPVDAPPAGWAYAWTFGDGGTSSQRSPSRDYADGGTYTVGLTVTDNDGQTSSASRSVTVTHVAPVAAFSFAPANPDPGETVQFTDGSTHPNAGVDSIASWAWTFGDGQSSTLQNPSVVYADMGNFDAQLCVTDDDGLQHCFSLRVPVGNNPPVAAWTHSPTTPTDLETVTFTDQSTDSDGTIVSWAWDFGDGATSTAQNPSHLFGDNGLYTVSLTVTDNLGAATTLSQVIEVLNVGPSASFTYGPSNPQVNDDIQFADTSSDPDGSIAARLWDFGDGTTSTAANPVHSYPDGGDYTVTLTVTDDDGAQSTTSQTVHVCETQVNLDGSGPILEFCLRIDL